MPLILSSSWEATAISSVAAKMPQAKAQQWHRTAGLFVYKHWRSCHHLQQISNQYDEMFGQITKWKGAQQDEESLSTSYSGPILENLYYELDGFFEAMRSAHDAVLNCLGSAGLLKSQPKSLNRFQETCRKTSRSSKAEGDDINVYLLDFWNKTGQTVKAYRDCLSHYVSLTGPTWQHAANAHRSRGVWKLTVALPDNPAARSYSKLLFNNRIDALTLCRQLNQETDNFVRETLTRCIRCWNADPQHQPSQSLIVSNVQVGE